MVYCFVGGDLFQFEVLGDGGEPVDPSDVIHGVSARYRSVDNLLWLEGAAGWDELLGLLRSAPIDDRAFTAAYREARHLGFEFLRSL